MAERTKEQAAALRTLEAEFEGRRARDAGLRQKLGGLGQYLVDSEAQLIALMNDTAPPAGGEIEFGMVLYWLHNDLPDDSFFRWLASQFPPTRITDQEYADWKATWEGAGVVAPDGTLIGTGTYEQLDKGWLLASVLYLLSVFTNRIPRFPFGTDPFTPTLEQETLRIALFGDWGTGTWDDCGTSGPADAIGEQIAQLSPAPDALIHLGDVYYAGTGDLSLEVNLAMIALAAELGITYLWNEETVRLVQAWQSNPPLSLTLNSNHEMYSAARGLFKDGLGSAPFLSQQGTSYFALTFQDWVILGLDSAYYTDSFAFMKGRLQDPQNTGQVDWVKGLDLSGKKVIALTHHTGLTYDGLPITPSSAGENNLYDDLYEALNNQDPDYWYWGHIHNGIVYSQQARLSPSRPTTTACRCLGHGALPFGNAYFWEGGEKKNLDQSPLVDFYTHTPLQNPSGCVRWENRVKNGFVVLTLGKGTLQEAYYEQGNPTPVWTSG